MSETTPPEDRERQRRAQHAARQRRYAATPAGRAKQRASKRAYRARLRTAEVIEDVPTTPTE